MTDPSDPQVRAAIVTEVVGALEEFPLHTMRLAHVGGRRITVIRTPSGVHAIDNACPHQGYGLTTGTVDGDVVTCQWHNWKFRVTDGHCLIGEEDVSCHRVDVIGGKVHVTVVQPSPADRLAALWPSLLRGLDRHYPGQIARDVARALEAGATPEQIVARALVHGAPRIDKGLGHEMAMAADCLQVAHLWEGLEQTLPVSQALSGIAETARDRPTQTLPEPDASIDLLAAIEREDVRAAMASVLGQVDVGAGVQALQRQLIEAASMHHLSYGHGAIYTQKAFELLERIGPAHARDVLPWVAMALTYSTREDLLPYMRTAMGEIEVVDLGALAAAPSQRATGWSDGGELRDAILGDAQAPITVAVAAVVAGAGIEGLLDAVSLAVSERLLRHDPSIDFDTSIDFGWLDITHGLTYANAARWAWRRHPCAATARLALFSLFLAHDTGRAERSGLVSARTALPDPVAGDVGIAVLDRRPDDAVAHCLAADPTEVGEALARAAMADRAGSFIVAAHVVKLTEAATRESAETGSMLPLAAATRFAAAPRLERFVAAAAAEAIDFVRTGSPPKR